MAPGSHRRFPLAESEWHRNWCGAFLTPATIAVATILYVSSFTVGAHAQTNGSMSTARSVAQSQSPSPTGGAVLSSDGARARENRDNAALETLRKAFGQPASDLAIAPSAQSILDTRREPPSEPLQRDERNVGAKPDDAPRDDLSAQAGAPRAPDTAPARSIAGEIRFGMIGPFSGPAKDLGRNMRIGLEAAFNEVNKTGGVNGRMLKLVSGDDGYEPSRTPDALAKLMEGDKIFGFVGNIGTPTAAITLPFALQNKMLFFGALTGAALVRRDPPDKYVFNYRPGYAEETEATVRYLVNVRRLRPDQIAVFAQEDAFGDSGYAGVEKAIRHLQNRAPNVMRMNYKRNTVDVDQAVAQLRSRRGAIKAVVMVATYRVAARFIEKTRDLLPDLIYTNVSFVGSTSLADELMLLGARYATGVIVTQVVPAVDGFASSMLEYRTALQESAAGEKPDYISLEGYIDGKLLISGLRAAGPTLTTDKLVDAFESMRTIDLGLGNTMSFSRSEHQASHKIWGTMLDKSGHYEPLDLD